MIKLMFAFLTIITMFAGQECSDVNKLKENILFSAYNNGNQIEMTEKDTQKFDDLFVALLKDCRVMPAYGVSLHDETMKAIEKGIWLRFQFDETMEINGLPFDELLINLTKDMYGFNVVRGNSGKYEGRCFYIDLPRNLDTLYEYMIELPVSENKFALREEIQASTLEQDLKIKEVFNEEDCENCKCHDGNCANAESMPSINKDNKKPNTVINQAEEALLEAIEF